jgi:hypothetical protein
VTSWRLAKKAYYFDNTGKVADMKIDLIASIAD